MHIYRYIWKMKKKNLWLYKDYFSKGRMASTQRSAITEVTVVCHVGSYLKLMFHVIFFWL